MVNFENFNPNFGIRLKVLLSATLLNATLLNAIALKNLANMKII